ncbi:MAG: DUF58 domain-containing protein [Clostridiales bacterium]
MKKNRIIVLLIFLLSLFFVYNYGGKVPYVFFYLSFIFPIISVVYTIYINFRFKIVQNIDRKYATKGETIEYSCSIYNEDFLIYPYMKVSFYEENNMLSDEIESRYFSLLPKTKHSFSVDINCKYRGHFVFGIKYIEIEDFLGIFKMRYSPTNSYLIEVSPRVVKLNRVKFNSIYFSESETNLGKNSGECTTFSDIRKYVYGDNFKRIHWKYTAKYNELMSKNYQTTAETNLTLIIDLKKFSSNKTINIIVEDILIESLISLINYSLNNMLKVTLLVYTDQLYKISSKNIQDFDKIYTVITKLKFDYNYNISTIMDLYLSTENSKSNVFLFSSNLDFDLFDSIYKTTSSGLELNLVYVNPEGFNIEEESLKIKNEIIKNLNQMNIPNYKLTKCEDIYSVFEI